MVIKRVLVLGVGFTFSGGRVLREAGRPGSGGYGGRWCRKTAVRESRGWGDWLLARLWVVALPEFRQEGRALATKEEGEGTPNTGRASGKGTTETEAPLSPPIVESSRRRRRERGCDRKTREVRGGAPLFRHPMAGSERRGGRNSAMVR